MDIGAETSLQSKSCIDTSFTESGHFCRLWQLTDSWHCRAAQWESPAALRLCDRREDKQEGVRRHVSAPCPAPASAPVATGPFCSAPAEPCLAGSGKKDRCWSMAQAWLLCSHRLFVYVFKLSIQPAHTEHIFLPRMKKQLNYFPTVQQSKMDQNSNIEGTAIRHNLKKRSLKSSHLWTQTYMDRHFAA